MEILPFPGKFPPPLASSFAALLATRRVSSSEIHTLRFQTSFERRRKATRIFQTEEKHVATLFHVARSTWPYFRRILCFSGPFFPNSEEGGNGAHVELLHQSHAVSRSRLCLSRLLRMYRTVRSNVREKETAGSKKLFVASNRAPTRLPRRWASFEFLIDALFCSQHFDNILFSPFRGSLSL